MSTEEKVQTTVLFSTEEKAKLYEQFINEHKPWGKFPYSAAITYEGDSLNGPHITIESPGFVPICQFFWDLHNDDGDVWITKRAAHGAEYTEMDPQVQNIVKDTLGGMVIHHKNGWCCGSDELEVYVKDGKHAIPIFHQRMPEDESTKCELVERDIFKFHNLIRKAMKLFPSSNNHYEYTMFKHVANYFESQHFPVQKTMNYMLEYEEYMRTGPLCWSIGDKFKWYQVMEVLSDVLYFGVYVFRYENLPLEVGPATLENWAKWIRSPSGNDKEDFKKDIVTLSASTLRSGNKGMTHPVFVMYFEDYHVDDKAKLKGKAKHKKSKRKYAGTESAFRFCRNGTHHISDKGYFALDISFIERLEVFHADIPRLLPKFYYLIVTFFGTRKVTEELELYDIYLRCKVPAD